MLQQQQVSRGYLGAQLNNTKQQYRLKFYGAHYLLENSPKQAY
jgi:hypothetical protein